MAGNGTSGTGGTTDRSGEPGGDAAGDRALREALRRAAAQLRRLAWAVDALPPPGPSGAAARAWRLLEEGLRVHAAALRLLAALATRVAVPDRAQCAGAGRYGPN